MTYADSRIKENNGYVTLPGDTLGKYQPRVPVWVVGVWERPRSLARVLRYDGLIPQKQAPPGQAPGPITPADLHSTIFRLLGYDPRAISYYTVDGRPTLLSDGEPIRELLS